MLETLLLCGFAFIAGFIDAIVGGGGLIQIPALLILQPHLAIATLFGINKLSSIAGTATAALQYGRSVTTIWSTVLPAAIAAFACSLLGARATSMIQPNVMRPMVLVLLIAVAIYTFVKKDFGNLHAPKLSLIKQFWVAIFVGGAIGFYDGFFGPGTGSFLMFAFIGLFGFDFLVAAASTKIVNFFTNLAAIIYFAATGHIVYSLAIPMAVCNMAGAVIGTKTALTKGSSFIRVLFLVIVSTLILKVGYDTYASFVGS